jgi:hydrogenase maturation protein HypF
LDGFERLGHLSYFTLAGGNKASKEAVRPLLALLRQAYGEGDVERFDWLLDRIEPDRDKRRVICQQLEQGINTVPTSSLGRVFDAVAAMVGLGSYNAFDAQLPMALESIVCADCEDCYPIECSDAGDGTWQLHIETVIRGIVEHVQQGTEPGVMAAMFHNSIAAGLLRMAQKARDQRQSNKVVMGGGVFCNRYLADVFIRRLRAEGFEVLYAQSIPANDGGISVGQAAIGVRTCG